MEQLLEGCPAVHLLLVLQFCGCCLFVDCPASSAEQTSMDRGSALALAVYAPDRLPPVQGLQPGVAAQLNAAAMAVGQLNPALAGAYAASANAMRVSVDKGRQTDLDHQFVAEDTTAKDHADEVMRRCEEVTKMLRKTLGKHTDGDRWGRHAALLTAPWAGLPRQGGSKDDVVRFRPGRLEPCCKGQRWARQSSWWLVSTAPRGAHSPCPFQP